jgi:hypothetical protein
MVRWASKAAIAAACLPCNFASGAAISCHFLPTQREGWLDT